MFTMHIRRIIHRRVVYANGDEKPGLAVEKEEEEERK